MKQEIALKTPSDKKKLVFSRSTTCSPGIKAPTKLKNSSRSELVNGVSPRTITRSKSVTPDPVISPKVKRSLGVDLNKGKSGEEVVGRSLNGSIRTRRRSDISFKGNGVDPDGEKRGLQEKLDASENLVRGLHLEILGLKSQLEDLQNLNVELELRNKQFVEDLSVAEAKILALSSSGQSSDQKDPVAVKIENLKFKDAQKLIQDRLVLKKNAIKDESSVEVPSEITVKPITKVSEMQARVSVNVVTPPPPPLPPMPHAPIRLSTAKKDTSLVEFYRTITKREGSKDALSPGNHSNSVVSSVHNSIVGEIQNRSAHLLAIKLDVETKGELIRSIIEKIQTASYTDIEDVLKFVDWIDNELSSLADERSVLKHFNWPESRADAMREAAIEYRDLKRLEVEISSYKDDSIMLCETALRKISSLLDKSERSLQRLFKLRNSTMVSYRDCKIPTDWMLDSGMVRKIKQVSMKLAKMYMKRVSMELESVRTVERESTQEALLLQGVRFAYRAHQFAGGLDSETMCAFEEIRQRVPVHVSASQELLAGITSS
ncbi:hypothetical protein GIB67_029842 [Kingdonia uniflora]|uniref:Protein CHUP1, chloroplastic n=1 Tax=Kingdonia uniflora TaxID=39325 RepID=A0A7J7NJQ5_9MAGN|nr:hypothetical protein GIB67_029842 [Kingdonia uniflora]